MRPAARLGHPPRVARFSAVAPLPMLEAITPDNPEIP